MRGERRGRIDVVVLLHLRPEAPPVSHHHGTAQRHLLCHGVVRDGVHPLLHDGQLHVLVVGPHQLRALVVESQGHAEAFVLLQRLPAIHIGNCLLYPFPLESGTAQEAEIPAGILGLSVHDGALGEHAQSVVGIAKVHATLHGPANGKHRFAEVIIDEVGCLVADADVDGVADDGRRDALVVVRIALRAEFAAVDEGDVAKHDHLACDGTFHPGCFGEHIPPPTFLHCPLHAHLGMEVVVGEVACLKAEEHRHGGDEHHSLADEQLARSEPSEEGEEHGEDESHVERNLERIVAQLIELELAEAVHPRLVGTHEVAACRLQHRHEPEREEEKEQRPYQTSP